MAGAPPGFAGALATKYQIMQQQADSAGNLARAQAGNITASTPFENALRQAQAYQTTQQANTLQPLADASVAATNAGIGETQARAGLYGAQGAELRSDLGNASPLHLSGAYRTLQQTFAPKGATSTTGQVVSPNPNVQGFADGTSDVGGGTHQEALTPGPQSSGNSGTPTNNDVPTPSNNYGANDHTLVPYRDHVPDSGGGIGGFGGGINDGFGGGGAGLVRKPQIADILNPIMHNPSAVGNADRITDPTNPSNQIRLYAMGTDRVPTPPGSTVTSGSWTGPTPAPGPIQPLPPTPLSGTDLRKRLGMGNPPVGYATGTANVKPSPSDAADREFHDFITRDLPPAIYERDYNMGRDHSNQNTGSGPTESYAKGTSKVPHGRGGRGAPMPPGKAMGPMGSPGAPPGMPMPAQMGSAMPGPMGAPGGPPGAGQGLQALLQAQMGANRVPGQMPPGGRGDTVPSMLTPGEAVVNNNGIKHIPGGRAGIAAANAKGNAEAGKGMMKKGKDGRAVHVHIHM